MKLIRALLMLGQFLILGFAAIVLIAVAVFEMISVNDEFDNVYALLERRSEYQLLEGSLLDMQVASREVGMVLYYDDPAVFDDVDGLVDESLASIEESLGYLDVIAYEDSDYAVITSFEGQRDTLADHYDEIRSMGSGDEVIALLGELAPVEQEINDQQAALMVDTNIQIQDYVRNLESAKTEAVWVVLVALMAFPLLAVVGFLLASRFTLPLLQIDNAVMSVGGDHYRRALMEDTLRRRDSLGRLAKNVDKMAAALEARDAALKKEVADLRQQLQDIRRRKLSTSVDIPVSELLGETHV